MDFGLNELEPMLRTFWFLALISSLIFIIQTILTFIGLDSHDGLGADFDSNIHDGDGPFQLFSLRNLINFFLGFSWTGIAFYNSVPQKAILVTIAILVGIGFVLIFFLIIRQLQKLAENNSFRIDETINKVAEVYLRIPEHMSGKGKVLISVRGATHELDAITESERLEQGTLVRVERIESGNILVVTSIKKIN